MPVTNIRMSYGGALLCLLLGVEPSQAAGVARGGGGVSRRMGRLAFSDQCCYWSKADRFHGKPYVQRVAKRGGRRRGQVTIPSADCGHIKQRAGEASFFIVPRRFLHFLRRNICNCNMQHLGIILYLNGIRAVLRRNHSRTNPWPVRIVNFAHIIVSEHVSHSSRRVKQSILSSIRY